MCCSHLLSSSATFPEMKAILDSPAPRPTVSLATREALLRAIAKARIWIDDLVEGRVSSFADIAEREAKVERHIRLLAPLAFVSPRIISDIIDGAACSRLTVTGLAKGLAYSWAAQEHSRPSQWRNSYLFFKG
jgi:site-specific DNA recombinase